MPASREPLGVVLAGGVGRRLGGAKACVPLGDHPLIAWPLRVLGAALGEVVIVAKLDTVLPELGSVAVVHEPPEPRHPLCGILTGLALAGGGPVLTCPVDLPFITPGLIAELRDAPLRAGEPVIARGAPLLGRFEPGCEASLRAAVARGASVRSVLHELGARELEVADAARTLLNVNSAEQLAAAQELLG